MSRTRLAPSPTGALHLGNARTFLVNWALARQRNWTIVLRVDDLDSPRVKQGADQQAIEVLQWLGCDWDEGPSFQSQRLMRYRAALDQLRQQSDIYPCRCTRSEIQAAQSAPHAGDHELRYPGTCRPRQPSSFTTGCLTDAGVTWRLRVPDQSYRFWDEFAGETTINVQSQVGDFAVATKNGVPSYQLAVVVDDHDQSIDCIVRGDDLLSSAVRQYWVRQRLGYTDSIRQWHIPLVVGTDGRRLAKRHGDSRLIQYRSCGVRSERIVGLLAEWCGCGPRQEMTAGQFLIRFAIERLPRQPIVFTDRDDQWLRAGGNENG